MKEKILFTEESTQLDNRQRDFDRNFMYYLPGQRGLGKKPVIPQSHTKIYNKKLVPPN